MYKGLLYKLCSHASHGTGLRVIETATVTNLRMEATEKFLITLLFVELSPQLLSIIGHYLMEQYFHKRLCCGQISTNSIPVFYISMKINRYLNNYSMCLLCVQMRYQ